MNVLPNWAKPIPPKWTTCLREMCDKCRCPIELLRHVYGDRNKLQNVSPDQLVRKVLESPRDDNMGYALLEEHGRGHGLDLGIQGPWVEDNIYDRELWTINQIKEWGKGHKVGLVECHRSKYFTCSQENCERLREIISLDDEAMEISERLKEFNILDMHQPEEQEGGEDMRENIQQPKPIYDVSRQYGTTMWPATAGDNPLEYTTRQWAWCARYDHVMETWEIAGQSVQHTRDILQRHRADEYVCGFCTTSTSVLKIYDRAVKHWHYCSVCGRVQMGFNPMMGNVFCNLCRVHIHPYRSGLRKPILVIDDFIGEFWKD